jgi:hypothetical protein
MRQPTPPVRALQGGRQGRTLCSIDVVRSTGSSKGKGKVHPTTGHEGPEGE